MVGRILESFSSCCKLPQNNHAMNVTQKRAVELGTELDNLREATFLGVWKFGREWVRFWPFYLQGLYLSTSLHIFVMLDLSTHSGVCITEADSFALYDEIKQYYKSAYKKEVQSCTILL